MAESLHTLESRQEIAEAQRRPNGLAELERIFDFILEADQIGQLQRLDPDQRAAFLRESERVYREQSSTPDSAPTHMGRLRSFMEGYSVMTASVVLGQTANAVRGSIGPLISVLNRDAAAIQDAFRAATATPIILDVQPIMALEPAIMTEAAYDETEAEQGRIEPPSDITIAYIQEPIVAEEGLPELDENLPSSQQLPSMQPDTGLTVQPETAPITSVAALVMRRRQAEQANRNDQALRRAAYQARLRRGLSLFQEPPASPKQALAAFAANGSRAGWRVLALCADPEQRIDSDNIFYPEDGTLTKEAKRLCKECTVRSLCLQEAVARKERYGTWGGVSEWGLRTIAVEGLGNVLRHSPESRIRQMVRYLGGSKHTEQRVARELYTNQQRPQLFVRSVLERYGAGRPKTDEVSITDLDRYFNGEELDIGWPSALHKKVLFRNIVGLADFLTSGEHGLADPIAHFWAQSEGP